MIVADVAADVDGYMWKTSRTSTVGSDDLDDGVANAADQLADDPVAHEVAAYCDGYTGGGKADWYPPSKNELTVIYNNLDPNGASTPTDFQDGGAQAFANFTTSNGYYWTSTQDGNAAWGVKFGDGLIALLNQDTATVRIRPIRRVPV